MKKITFTLLFFIATKAIFSQGIQALDGSSNYYRYATVYDWDCCLFGPGFNDGQPYAYLVDGHYKISYDNTGQGTIIEATGNYVSMYPIGSSYNQNFGYSSNPIYKSLITDASCCNALGDKIFVQLSNEIVLSTLEREKKSTVAVYPNPTSDFLFHNGKKNQNFQIVDATGNNITSGKIQDNKIDVHQLISGYYFIIIKEKTYKFLKK